MIPDDCLGKGEAMRRPTSPCVRAKHDPSRVAATQISMAKASSPQSSCHPTLYRRYAAISSG
ncbi:MAG: hypothetical protein IKR48_11090, partial [Kiritimatiellae bacterium]|nr:hypothetical protein [Kiritimatiellia bacterium]